MLREQIRLVEQFVEINQRMYESYSTGINSSYRYTTLEDTQQVRGEHPRTTKFARDCSCSIFQFSCCLFLSLQFIRRNRPKTISYEEALEQVKQEQRWQISKSSLHYSETAFQKRFLSLWKTWILRVDFLFDVLLGLKHCVYVFCSKIHIDIENTKTLWSQSSSLWNNLR